MGFFSGIASCLTSVVSVITKVAEPLIALARPVLEIAKSVVGIVLKAVVELVHAVAQAFGCVPEDMDQDELGARAMQNPEIKPEDYDSTTAYIDGLKKAPFDEAKFKNSTTLEKQAFTAVGAGIETKAIAEKIEMSIPMDFFVTCAKGGIKDGAMGKQLLLSMKAQGIEDAGAFTEFINGDIDSADKFKMGKAVTDFENNGGKSVESIRQDIVNNTLENENSNDI